MKIKKIENRLAYFIITLAITLLNIKKLSLLSLVLGSFLAFLVITLFEKLNLAKYKIVKIFLILSSFWFVIIYLNKITYFIGDNILRDYSLIIISLLLLISIYYLSSKGYHTIIKVITLSSFFLIFFFSLGFLLTIFYFKFTNLTIKLLQDKNLLMSTLAYTSFLIYTYFLIYPMTNTKFKGRDLIVSTSFQILTFLNIIGVLNFTLTNLYKYPYIIIFKMVNLLGFINRIEIIFSLNYLFIFFFLLLLSFYQIRYQLTFFLKKDKKLNIVLIVIAIIIFLINLFLT